MALPVFVFPIKCLFGFDGSMAMVAHDNPKYSPLKNFIQNKKKYSPHKCFIQIQDKCFEFFRMKYVFMTWKLLSISEM